MISLNKDYSYLLDKIREEVNRNPLNVRLDDNEYGLYYTFAYNYFYAYIYLLEKRNIPVGDNIRDVIFSDYNTFNSFINNCVKEYEMFDEIGTGKVTYFPYQELADFLYVEKRRNIKNFINKTILSKNENEKRQVKS